MILPISKFNSVARCIFDVKCGLGLSLTCAPAKSRIGKETNREKIEEFYAFICYIFFCVVKQSKVFT
jgi:hypothetical protein